MNRTLSAIALIGLAALPANAIQISLTDSISSPESTAMVFQPLGVLPEMVAFESMGAVLENRIEFRYNAALDLQAITLEPGWSLQSLVVTEGLEQVGLSTFYFSGFDSQNDSEYHRFYNPWDFSFSFTDAAGPQVTAEIPLQIDVFASAMLMGSGRIPVSASSSFTGNDAIPVADTGNTLLLLSMGTAMLLGVVLDGKRKHWQSETLSSQDV